MNKELSDHMVQKSQAKKLPQFPPLLCLQTLNSADGCREKQSGINTEEPFWDKQLNNVPKVPLIQTKRRQYRK